MYSPRLTNIKGYCGGLVVSSSAKILNPNVKVTTPVVNQLKGRHVPLVVYAPIEYAQCSDLWRTCADIEPVTDSVCLLHRSKRTIGDFTFNEDMQLWHDTLSEAGLKYEDLPVVSGSISEEFFGKIICYVHPFYAPVESEFNDDGGVVYGEPGYAMPTTTVDEKTLRDYHSNNKTVLKAAHLGGTSYSGPILNFSMSASHHIKQLKKMGVDIGNNPTFFNHVQGSLWLSYYIWLAARRRYKQLGAYRIQPKDISDKVYLPMASPYIDNNMVNVDMEAKGHINVNYPRPVTVCVLK